MLCQHSRLFAEVYQSFPSLAGPAGSWLSLCLRLGDPLGSTAAFVILLYRLAVSKTGAFPFGTCPPHKFLFSSPGTFSPPVPSGAIDTAAKQKQSDVYSSCLRSEPEKKR